MPRSWFDRIFERFSHTNRSRGDSFRSLNDAMDDLHGTLDDLSAEISNLEEPGHENQNNYDRIRNSYQTWSETVTTTRVRRKKNYFIHSPSHDFGGSK